MIIQPTKTRRRRAVLLAVLLVMSALTITAGATSSRVSGIDVRPVSWDIVYTNNADFQNYGILSSHDPSALGLNRPSNLWIVDGMVNVSLRVEVVVENIGTTASGQFNVQIVIEHDEYQEFILFDQTAGVGNLAAGATTTITATWIPNYGGNHSMWAETLHTNDDNGGNDRLNRHLTIGMMYDTCETAGQWTMGTGWSRSSETSLSGSYTYHVGGATSSSNYGNNWNTYLESQLLKTGDAHPSPTRGYGVGFFYTGDVLAGDGLNVDVWTGTGWQRISGNTIDGFVDGDMSDGSSWVIQINTVNGQVVPWYSIPPSAMNNDFKIRFSFSSDASGTSIGYWLEDIVLFYDQKAFREEYSVLLTAGQSGHARAGEWAEQPLTLRNNGNLTDQISPSLSGLPNGWNAKFQHMSGSQIPTGTTLDLAPGESRNIKLLVQPPAGTPMGSQNLDVTISSSEQHTSDTVQVTVTIDPAYQPEWEQGAHNHLCLPGDTCDFQLWLENAGDGQDTFSISTSEILSHSGWTWGLTWDQTSSVTIAAGAGEYISISANVPSSALTGMKATTDFIATSQADTSKTSVLRSNVTASMVSSGSVAVDPADIPEGGWWIEPGGSATVPFTIWNNATRQDTYTFSLETANDLRGWSITLPSNTDVVISQGGVARLLVTITAATNAQANDPVPTIIPHAISSESGTEATSYQFYDVRVSMMHDLQLSLSQTPTLILPGQATAFAFEVENAGNGPELLMMAVEGIPSGWQWWVEVDGALVSGPVTLTPEYEQGHIVNGVVWVEAPGSEEPGQVLDFTITATPYEGEDAFPDDNSVFVTVQTQQTVVAMITELPAEFTSAYIGQELSWDVTLSNDGNSYDNTLRARVMVDSIRTGMLVQMESDRGIGQLNGWVEMPLGGGEYELLTITFLTFDDFPLGQSVVITLEVESTWGGEATVIVRTEHTVMVDQRRDLEVVSSLLEPYLFLPSETHAFTIDITTRSTMPITVELQITSPDSVEITCRPRTQSGEYRLLLPIAMNGIEQTQTFTCDFTIASDDQARTVYLTIVDDDGEEVWNSGPIHMKTPILEETGGFSWSSVLGVQAIAISAAVLFIAFFLVMSVLILRRRKHLTELEELEEEEEGEGYTPAVTAPAMSAAVSVARPPQIAATAPVVAAPAVAAPAHQQTTQSANPGWIWDASSNQWVADPAYSAALPTTDAQPAEQVQPQSGLENAFGALGEPEAEQGADSSVQASAEPEAQAGDQTVGYEQHVAPTNGGPLLPSFQCMVTGVELTAEVAWWQCSSCGGFAASHAIEDMTACPRCEHDF